MKFPRSSAYIRGVRDFFVEKGFTVDLRLGRQPDDDVVYMSRAKHFIQGGGGFSIVIAGIVRELGGQVLQKYGPGSAYAKQDTV